MYYVYNLSFKEIKIFFFIIFIIISVMIFKILEIGNSNLVYFNYS